MLSNTFVSVAVWLTDWLGEVGVDGLGKMAVPVP